MRVVVIQTGAANLASVRAGLSRLGAEPVLTDDPEVVARAERVMLPGVGAFGPAMEGLRRRGLAEALRERVRASRPLLGICLGLQLLCEGSEEAPGVPGLGVLPGVVRRFRDGVRTPHMGWNAVRGAMQGWAYFANSYRLEHPPDGFEVATSEHGGPFVAAVRRGPLLACQFHPELSGPWGEAVLAAWLRDAPLPSTQGCGASDLAPRVIPCLDVRDGRVVKGVRFQGLRDAGDPVEASARYQEQGADELVLLDVSATPEGRGHGLETVREVRRALSMPLTVGGGVRTVEDAGRLLDAGADKVGVNTAAVARPALLAELAERFGRQCVVLALDAARRAGGDGWEVVVRSGRERTGRDAIGWARDAVALGAGEILLTSWDRDGTQSGYDLELVAAVSDAVPVPVIASGGAAGAEHLAEALRSGASAVLAASIFHDGHTTVAEIKQELARGGLEVRR
jgi:imidazole glycerol phosphate synthase glutamine amidotransferase subunit